ncbi:MAG: MFS transporter, partial [Actinomycetota bacterium]|nr:MFS transporter [Actinomycetota bacterium]
MQARGGVLAPLKERDFAFLWTGMAVSLIGDGVLLVALAWQVYDLANSPAAMAGRRDGHDRAPRGPLLVGGVVSDRFDRRKVDDRVRHRAGAVVGLLGLLSVTGGLRLWHVFPLVVAYGAATAFFGPAFDAPVPDVVSPEHLTQANAIERFVRPAATAW